VYINLSAEFFTTHLFDDLDEADTIKISVQ